MEQVMKHTMNVINFRMHAALVNSLLLSLTLLGIIPAAHADETPNYTIEVIVFENHALKGWTEEQWSDEIELPITEGSTSVFTRDKRPLYIQTRDRSLNEVAKKMSNGYRILFHQAWSQNASGSKNAPTVLIENDRKDGAQMMGTVKLYKTRFAHVEIDLEFEKAIPVQVREAFAENQQIGLEDLPSHWRFNLKEARKIKNGQLHYIDHPLFGVLVQLHKNN